MVATVPAALLIMFLYPLPLAYARLELFVAEDSLNRQITFVSARHLDGLLVQKFCLLLGLSDGCSFFSQPLSAVGRFELVYLLLLKSHSTFFIKSQGAF